MKRRLIVCTLVAVWMAAVLVGSTPAHAMVDSGTTSAVPAGADRSSQGLVGTPGSRALRTGGADLVASTANATAQGSSATQQRCPPTIRRGAHGYWVVQLQLALHNFGYMYRWEVDGRFGPRTQAVVKQFQWESRLQVDGIVGPQTWKALGWCA